MAVLSDKVVMTFHEKFKQYDLGEGHLTEETVS